MKKISIFIILFSIVSLSASSQMMESKIELPMLSLKSDAIEASLSEVSKYMSEKPNGMRYPVSRVKFVEVKGGFSLEVEGIDNSWRNLFRYGESMYGYAIVRNRLFVVLGLVKEEIDLNNIFYMSGGQKSFTKGHLPNTGVVKNPKWYFEYIDGISRKIKDEDLDALD